MSNCRRPISATIAAGSLGAVFLFVASASCLAAQTVSPAVELPCAVLSLAAVMQDPDGCAVTLSPLETKTLRLAIPAGSVRKLIAEQTSGSVELRLSQAENAAAGNSDSRANASGLHSKIRVLLSAGQQVSITNPSKDKPATVTVMAEPSHIADRDSAREQSAESDFAHAEFLRARDTRGPEDALKLYDRAIATWRALGDREQLASALIWKSDFFVNNQSNGAVAAATLQQAADFLNVLEPIEVAHYWQVLAFTHAEKAEYDAALSSYTTSLEFCEKVGDASYEAKLLDNIARIQFMQGKAETATATEFRAADFARRAGDTRREAYVEEMLGAVESSLGDFEAAYQAYGRALLLLKQLPPNPRIQAAVWTDLSDYYLTLGDLGKVRDSLEQALAMWKTTSYPVGLVDTLNNLGDLYILKGQPKTARAYFARALDTSEKIGYERGSIALLTGTGESYLAQKDGVRAQRILVRAEARAEKAGQDDSEISIECDLGDAAVLRRDFKRASEYYEKCRAQAVTSHDQYNEIRSEGSLAHAAFESGALEEAETHCEHALGGIEAIRGHLRNQDLRTSFLASQHAYYDLDIQILMRLGREHPDEGYVWRAFLIAERARARTLLDQVTAANSDVSAVASQALLAEYDDVQRRLRRLEARPTAQDGAQENAASSATRSVVARLTVTEHELHQEIAAEGTAEGAPSAGLTLESLQSILPDDHSALMEYWTGENASYAWSITREGIRNFRLPPSTILDPQCAAFRKALLATAVRDPRISIEERVRNQSAMEAKWKQLGASLAATLFPASALPANTSTVLVIGDGGVETLPFVTLPGLSLIPSASGRLRRITFLNEPSATVFSLLEERSMSSRPFRLAVFTADPSPDRSSTRGPRKSIEDTSLNHPDDSTPLPFTGNEANSIRDIFGPDAVQTFPAASISPSALRNLDWKGFSIGHFAMHAVLNQKYAELTALSFGEKPDSGSHSGRLLWYGDIRNLHAKLELVVLSACNTALGEQVPGEGLRGLTQAFFAAGSQRVVGTLWEVDDQATSEWMRHFYQALKETRSPAKALQRAQRTMASDPRWSDPYYWAGFVLAGDWRPIQ
jgi:CHAT domain-containing protein